MTLLIRVRVRVNPNLRVTLGLGLGLGLGLTLKYISRGLMAGVPLTLLIRVLSLWNPAAGRRREYI